MWRRVLRATGAILLWVVSAVGAQHAVADEPAEADKPPVLQFGEQDSVNLNGNSVYWVDLRGERSVDQVEASSEALPWRTRRRDSQGPVHDGALWIRFDASVPLGQRWYLEVAASFHDKVQLFHRDAAGAWVTQNAGTTSAVSDWAVPGRLPMSSLPISLADYSSQPPVH